MLSRKLAVLASAGTLLALSTSGAYAASVSADYTQALTTDGDEDVVAAFNIYDFAVGVALRRPAEDNVGTAEAPVVGDSFTGYYQSYLTGHQLDGIMQASPGLNTTGSGTGYEITVIAEYTEVITAAGGGTFTSSITGGSGSIYFDTSPDYNFTTDSGFDNGDAIVSGNIVGGDSVALPAAGSGFSQIQLEITDQNSSIFSPEIAMATGIFTLALNSSAGVGVTSVQGIELAAGDLLLGADGNLELQPVPVPAAVWLLGSALVGLTALRRGATS